MNVRPSLIAVGSAAALVGGIAVAGPANAQRPAAAMYRSAPRYIVNSATGLCMTVHGGSRAKGAKVDLYRCVGAANQRWTLVPMRDTQQIVNVKSGLCLDVLGGRKGNGALLGQWTCNGKSNQRFLINSMAGGGFMIVSAVSLREVQPKYHDRRANNPIHQWAAKGKWARWHH
ncbi:RICIN domain-containing protein [Actinoallomurus sp. NPDC052274]|uniref:RICIN domain-containing protein n=1 Tax=Actinoallomurus sp. NPDC052274 TaxID=3155420 RepID=UPI00342362CD